MKVLWAQLFLVGSAWLVASSAWAQPADEVARGRQVFKLCEGCHTMVKGEHRFGPSLAGVMGRRAGHLPGYAFSDALMRSRLKWDRVTMTKWLEDEPKNLVPGTRMEFPGLSDPADVKALVSYLSTVK